MKLHGLVVALALGLLPTAARAQTITEQEFAGKWLVQFLDSTGAPQMLKNPKTGELQPYQDSINIPVASDTTWQLLGDTMAYGRKPEKRKRRRRPDGQMFFLLTREKDQKIAWQRFDVDSTGKKTLVKGKVLFTTRLEAPQSKP